MTDPSATSATTDPSAAVSGVFDRAADSYDTVGVPWFAPIADGLVEQLAARPGERVLDVGCGRGAALLPLARAVGPTGAAIGIDLAPRMVDLTARDAADLPWVHVLLGDASAPALPASSFDVVSASLVLFFLADPVAALRAWRGLLVPDGRLGITTFAEQDERWQEFDALFRPYLPPTLMDVRTSGRRGPFASDQGVADLLAAAGFTGISTAHRDVEAVFADAEQLIAFTWSHGQRAMWECVPPSARAHVRGQILATANRFGADSGPLRLRQRVRYTLGSAGAHTG